MNCASRGILVVLVLAPLGLWGCGQDKSSNNSGKIRDLAARNAKLEDDNRIATTTTEGLRKQLVQTEARRAELAQLVEQLEQAVRERDELRKIVGSRTSERDALHAQLTQFGKELQSLAGRIEAASTIRGGSPSPATAMAAHD